MKIKEKTSYFLENPWVHVATIALVLGLSTLFGALGYFVGMAVVLTTLWAKKWDWKYFGVSKPNWKKSILQGIFYALGIFVISEIAMEPVIDHFFGESDLSNFDSLKGNLANYIVMSLFMWVIAAFGEEMLYRGYIVKRVAAILGDVNWAWLIAILISSIIFGLAHMYQGPAGMVGTGVIGFLTGLIFLRNKNNLLVCMFTHGFYDMIGITLLYMGITDIEGLWELLGSYL